MAAVLAVGEGAVLSHVSAAVLWGLLAHDPPRRPVDVTVPRALHQRRGIRVHSVSALPESDIARQAAIPVTSPMRTLLDLAAAPTTEPTLRRAVRLAQVHRLATERALRSRLEDHRGKGSARSRALLGAGPAPTRSELEDRVLQLMHDQGLPHPAVNATIAGLAREVEADFLFAQHNLIVEADGARYHDSPAARRDDAERQAMLEAAGFRVLRVTWDPGHAPSRTDGQARAPRTARTRRRRDLNKAPTPPPRGESCSRTRLVARRTAGGSRGRRPCCRCPTGGCRRRAGGPPSHR